MLFKKRKAEAYIDTVVTVFLSLIIMYFVVNLFVFLIKYEKIDNLAGNMIDYCAKEGYASATDVKEKFNKYIFEAGFDPEDVNIRFNDTDYSTEFGEDKVQYGDKIVLSLSYNHNLALVDSDIISFPMSISKSELSEKYWRRSDNIPAALYHYKEIPNGGLYYVCTNYKEMYQLTYNETPLAEGDKFPDVSHPGDLYVYGDYIYCYNGAPTDIDVEHMHDYTVDSLFDDYDSLFFADTTHNGWSVKVRKKDKESYGAILKEINNIPVVSLNATFKKCTSMKTAPQMPDSIRNMDYAFEGCSSLISVSEFPEGVLSLDNTFYECESLISVGVIPSSVKNMNSCFNSCVSLEEAPIMSDGVINMAYTFSGCYSLKNIRYLPATVEKLEGTFIACSSLTTASNIIIPSGITKIQSLFLGCSKLTSAPTVPDSIIEMNGAFANCSSLKRVTINANPTVYTNALRGTAIKDVSQIYGSTSRAAELVATNP